MVSDGVITGLIILADDVRQKSNKLLKHLLKRGIRVQIYWHESEMYRFA